MKFFFKNLHSIFYSTCISCLITANAFSQTPALVGYWQNWQVGNSPYIQLDQVDARYNYVHLAFAVPGAGTDYKMQFTPDQVSQATLISQIQILQGQGRKIVISIGGATAPIALSSDVERDTFIVTMTNIINTYNFDGMDIDLEGNSLTLAGGTISNPTTPTIVRMIFAIKQIMANYYTSHGKKLILTMAPETAFVQGGMSAYSGIWGAYLPVIHALRDSLDMLNVQLYNSGSMYGIDGNIYTQGTADFIVAMTEAAIMGFNTAGGFFNGLPASKVGVGLPACVDAAGGGFTDTATVRAAINYLRGVGAKPGSYTLATAGGYPNLKGMMTWSINWDKVATCGGVYEFATNFQNIFNPVSPCSTCPVPSNLTTTNITATTAKLNYTTNACAISYQVKYKVLGTSVWSTANINSINSFKTITGLAANTKYVWKIRSKCSLSPLTFSVFSATKTFKTAVARLEENYASSIKIYPNPVTDILKVELDEDLFFSYHIELFNALGTSVFNENISSKQFEINLSQFERGIYFLRIGDRNIKVMKL